MAAAADGADSPAAIDSKSTTAKRKAAPRDTDSDSTAHESTNEAEGGGGAASTKRIRIEPSVDFKAEVLPPVRESRAAAAAVAATGSRATGGSGGDGSSGGARISAGVSAAFDGGEEMHPRNMYRTSPPDFAALASAYPEFAPFVRLNKTNHPGSVNWNDPHALLALSTVLLRHDFNLLFSMPVNHLCPPITQRLNYIHWVADLIDSIGWCGAVRGLDIGTGASAIFPLLGYATYGWSFVGSEVDPESVASAQENINRNQLQSVIEIRHQTDRKLILSGAAVKDDDRFDFCVCNPPFFSSLEQTGLNAKRVCEATASELVCEGGELAFITTMIEDSIRLGTRIQWYTTMCGRKETLKAVQQILRSTPNVAVTRHTTFIQGKQSRWGVAWTFDSTVRERIMKHAKQHTASAVGSSASAVAASRNPRGGSGPASTAAGAAAVPVRSKHAFAVHCVKPMEVMNTIRQKLLASYSDSHGLVLSAGGGPTAGDQFRIREEFVRANTNTSHDSKTAAAATATATAIASPTASGFGFELAILATNRKSTRPTAAGDGMETVSEFSVNISFRNPTPPKKSTAPSAPPIPVPVAQRVSDLQNSKRQFTDFCLWINSQLIQPK